jgi:protein gp37
VRKVRTTQSAALVKTSSIDARSHSTRRTVGIGSVVIYEDVRRCPFVSMQPRAIFVQQNDELLRGDH